VTERSDLVPEMPPVWNIQDVDVGTNLPPNAPTAGSVFGVMSDMDMREVLDAASCP